MTNRSYYIELIFLPVSRSRKKNAYLITNLRDIVKSLSHDVKLHILEEKLNFLKVAALNMIMKQRIAFLQNMRQQGRKLGVGKTEKFKKLENWHLFGPLAQKYLNRIKSFPYIILNNKYYSGIPRNYSVLEFFERYLLNFKYLYFALYSEY